MTHKVLLLLRLAFFLMTSTAATAWALSAAQPPTRSRDLTELSIEELMNIEVTTASKKGQRLAEAAAAIYVITQEDIHRSGATSIAEALRMAPGLNVARINANQWAISARGFNGRFSNKLLVLIDGRTVYTPLFSGVFWDVQDTLLEDIDRIEVIRGPAGTLWGANAVNGVINIITKNAKETQGGLITAGGGTEEQGFGALRYGAKLGENVYLRAFGKGFTRDDFSGGGSGRDSHDEWRIGRGGFRMDWDLTGRDSLTFLGDYYNGKVGDRFAVSTLSPPFTSFPKGNFPVEGGNLLGRWQRRFSSTSDMKLQLYYDQTERETQVVRESRKTFDIEFQHRFPLTLRHDLVWGLGYRLSADQIRNSETIVFDPRGRNDHLFSGFVQDDISLVNKYLRLILGSKFEHNEYTGFEIQPSARLLWTPDERQTVWGAISRAVRSPSRFEHTMRGNLEVNPPLSPSCPALIPCQVAIVGNRDFQSEDLLAYEVGYRSQLTPRLSVDVATFYHVYNDLRTFEPGTPFVETNPLPPHLVIPLRVDNNMDGESFGVEIAGGWNVTDYWKLSAAYTYLKFRLDLDKSSGDTLSESAEGDSPPNQFHLRSNLDLPHNWKFDTALYYIDRVPNQEASSYVRVDARLGWYATKDLELSIVGQNLFDRRHREFGSGFLQNPTRIERSVYGKITWRF